MTANYKHVREIGQGSHGRVDEVEDINTGIRYAIKSYQEEIARQYCPARREIDLLVTARTPYLPEVREVIVQDSKPQVVMELADCNLEELVDHKTEIPSYNDRFQICIHLINAVFYLHYQGVLHCDLKYQNIIFKSNKLMLIDLCHSVTIKDHVPGLKFITWNSPKLCRAPELHTKQDYQIYQNKYHWSTDNLPIHCYLTFEEHQDAEIFSLGCLLRRILCWVQDNDGDEVFRTFHQSKYPLDRRYRIITEAVGVSRRSYLDPLIKLIAKMTSYNPNDRPGWDVINQVTILSEPIKPIVLLSPILDELQDLASELVEVSQIMDECHISPYHQEIVMTYLQANIIKVLALTRDSNQQGVKTALAVSLILSSGGIVHHDQYVAARKLLHPYHISTINEIAGQVFASNRGINSFQVSK